MGFVGSSGKVQDMTKPTRCLLVRNKPYGKVDAFDLAHRNKCAFVGYPAISGASVSDATTLQELVTPFNVGSQRWEAYKKRRLSNSGKHTEHRNKCLDLIQNPTLLMMPRLANGCVYIGRFTAFSFHEAPEWKDDFLKLYAQAAIKETDRDSNLVALASVCQTLDVDEWIKVPFVNLPAWIRAKCFGQSSMMWIESAHGQSAYDALEGARSGVSVRPIEPTSDPSEVQKRLLDMLTAEPFEHLMVALLQLQYPEQTWLQVGGPGDGGADGIGFDADGRVVGVLQCKWHYDGAVVEAEAKAEVPIHLAYLVGSRCEGTIAPKMSLYDLSTVAALVIEHADRLPIASTLKVRKL